VEPELLVCLARSRVRDLLRDAEHRRLLRARAVTARPLRREIGRAIQCLGYAALTLGDAIAESR